MKKKMGIVSAVLGFGAAAVAALAVQGAPPGPSAEHKMLEKYVGTWECDVETSGGPGMQAEKNKGTSTSRLACGGLWLVTDFESTMMGGPFSGHETLGYDPATKKYQTVWVDSMSTRPSIGEGVFDEKAKSLTTMMKGFDPSGAAQNWRQVESWKDADTREWTMYHAGPDGAEMAAIKILYRRKK